jgi:SAM-dependent methyltransferase
MPEDINGIEKKRFGLNDIDKFVVTDASLGEHQTRFEELKLEDENVIPLNGHIVNIGSGINRKLEKDLLIKRPDINFISIDPSWAIKKYTGEEHKGEENKRWDIITHDGERDFVVYKRNNLSGGKDIEPNNKKDKLKLENKTLFTDSEIENHWRERMNASCKTKQAEGAFAMLAPDLGIKSNSIDAVIDSFGAYQHLESDDLKECYLREIVRILRSGCSAYIFVDNQYYFKGMAKKIDNIQLDEARLHLRPVVKITKL